jgi:drug/metabolite transporter (DMT)-like permease
VSLFSARSAWAPAVASAPSARPFARSPGRRRRLAPPAPATTKAGADRRLLAIAAILASTVAFPLSDVGSQILMKTLPPMEVAWLRYFVFFLSVLPLLARGGIVLRSAQPGLQVLRGAGSALSTLCAIISFHYLAVPTTTAICFVAPVIVTALAAVVLKEAVGVRRWAAALVALAGVLVIVQPGSDSFRLEALIPLAGALASAVAVICTRSNTADGSGTTMFYSGVTGLVIITGFMIPGWQTPTMAEWGLALLLGLFGTLGSLLQVLAYRLAPASLLSPFTYTQLIWASGLSFLLLGIVPGVAMAAGGTLIALSAIYTGFRERARGVA